MTIPFEPPHEPRLGRSPGPLWERYVQEVGITIYRKDGVWHEAPEGYEESLLDGATRVYRGGREYMITPEEFEELGEGGYTDTPYDLFLPFYPSDHAYPYGG